MTTTGQTTQMPAFLQSMTDFSEHLRDQFEDKENNEKGDAFVAFVVKLLPLLDIWPDLPVPTINEKKTHDRGVDFVSKSADRSMWVCGQSKYRIRTVAEIDEVVSKFLNFENATFKKIEEQSGPPTLFGDASAAPKAKKPTAKKKKLSVTDVDDTQVQKPTIRFMLVTSSDITRNLAEYEKSTLASLEGYNTLKREGRIDFIHGQVLFDVLCNIYRQQFFVTSEMVLDLESPFIQSDNVYVSILSGKTLSDLYAKHGSSLFFENIREFLGTKAASAEMGNVNHEIIETLRSKPKRMLGRNNGVTIKAEKVEIESPNRLKLFNCSIVNGCQTTMCIVHVGSAADSAKVLAKIVEDEDSWDIAKAANYQNSVSRLELDLARFLRPQTIRRTATNSGYSIQPSEEIRSVSNVLESISTNRLSYEAVRTLVLGIFSRFPNNMFSSNYSELRIDILGEFYAREKGEQLIETLFTLLTAMKAAVAYCETRFAQNNLADTFRRFFKEEKPQYQCLIAILTACACTANPLTNKPEGAEDGYKLIHRFLARMTIVLERHEEYFMRVFRHAFVVVASKILEEVPDGSQEIMQKMYKELKTASGSSFDSLFNRLRLQMDNDDSLEELAPVFDEE